MKRFFAILCTALCLISCSCGDEVQSSSSGEAITLNTPVVSINEDGVASWSVEGAIGYEYQISGKNAIQVGANVTQIKLLGGESIRVRALGDGVGTLSSEWSESASKIIQLKTPVLNQRALPTGQVLVSWELDEKASSYQYRLGSGSPVPITESAFLVNAGDAFYLQALGDGKTYDNSEWALIIAQK